MKKETILIAGGSGLVGQHLVSRLRNNYDISIMSRRQKQKDRIHYHAWNIDHEEMNPEHAQVDHIINLTGAGIADKRWTATRKKELIDSRVKSNKTILKALKSIRRKPKTFLAASAIGFYGNGGAIIFTEESPSSKNDFMSDCCIQWEQSSTSLEPYVDRLAIFRLGIVLSTKDGALSKMLPPTNFGLAPYFGDGNQYYSWIHIDDLCSIFENALSDSRFKGILNTVVPEAVQNKVFMKNLLDANGKKGLLSPVPKWLIRILFGEMADTILNSTRVAPKFLESIDFKFEHPHLKEAIADLIQQKI